MNFREDVRATADAVRAGEMKATEAVAAALDVIAERNPVLNAFVHVDAEAALRDAALVDEAVAAGRDPGPLAGVPIGVKDLEDVAGMPTTQGSLLLMDRGPVPADSRHVALLRAAGAGPPGARPRSPASSA